MIRATFNHDALGDYRVDGGRLLSLIDAVVAPLHARGDLHDLAMTTRRKMRVGSGVVETVGGDPSSLVDGEVPHPDSLDIDIHGRIGSHGVHGTFLFSIRLDPRNGDQIYAAGPRDEALQAFETMKRVMEGAVVPPPPVPPEPAATRIRRIVATSRNYYALLVLAVAAMLVGLFLSTAIMVAGYGAFAAALVILVLIPRSKHVSWEERLDRRQAARTIDLSLPEAGPLAIEHLRLLPAPGEA